MNEPKTEKVVQLNADGYFVGFTVAEESPLEPGVFLYPYQAFPIESPDLEKIEAGYAARREINEWIYEEPVQEKAPEEVSPVELTAEQKLAICKLEAVARLQATDYSQYPDTASWISNKTEFDAYRAAVRLLMINPVEEPIWPSEPKPIWVVPESPTVEPVSETTPVEPEQGQA